MAFRGRRLRATDHLHHTATRCPCGAAYFVFYAARSYSGQDSYTARVPCPRCGERTTVVAVAELGGVASFAADELPPDFARRRFGDAPLGVLFARGLRLRTRLQVLARSPVAWLLLAGLLVVLWLRTR